MEKPIALPTANVHDRELKLQTYLEVPRFLGRLLNSTHLSVPAGCPHPIRVDDAQKSCMYYIGLHECQHFPHGVNDSAQTPQTRAVVSLRRM
jgi:hypothetical protein